jgi:hypothetical protein
LNDIVQANAEQSKRWPFLFIAGLSDAAIFVQIAWKRHTGILDSSAAILSCWISIALFSAIWVAMLWHRRADSSTRSQFPTLAGILAAAVATGALTTIVVRSMPSADITFALSGRPLDEISSPQRRLLIELLRKNNANSQGYASIIAHTKPMKPALYSAESFQDKPTMQLTMDRLNAVYREDLNYAAEQQTDLMDFETKMSVTDSKWLKSWKRSDARREAAQDQLLALEKRWVANTNALYEYAIEHQDNVHLVQGVLKFSSAAVETEFREQMTGCIRLQQQVQEMTQRLAKDQQARRHANGLN